jgi:hypothetical protein
MNQIICDAIREKKVISFQYNGFDRVVEPHAHGISTAGNPCLRCYQISGGSASRRVPDWKMMRTDAISGLTVSENTFSSPRPGYKKGDRGMSRIFCEL